MPYGLPKPTLDNLITLLRRDDGIRKIWIFGSRAMGREEMGSDIDICVDAPSMEMSRLAVLEEQIDDLLMPWKVDLAVLQQIDDPNLLAHIQRVGIDLTNGSAS